MGEYEWYIHYPSDPASHAVEMMDEKDLGLYMRLSRLAAGEEVERLLGGGSGGGVMTAMQAEGAGGGVGVGEGRGGGMEEEERRAGFYEGWLRAAG